MVYLPHYAYECLCSQLRFALVSPHALTGNLGLNHHAGSSNGAELRASPNGPALLPDHRSFYSTGKYCLCSRLNLPWALSSSPERSVTAPLQTKEQPLLT